MKVGSAVQPRVDACDADGPSEIAHGIEKCAGHFQAVGRNRSEGHICRGNDAQQHGKTAQKLRPEKLHTGPLRGDRRHLPERKREEKSPIVMRSRGVGLSRKLRHERSGKNHGQAGTHDPFADLQGIETRDPREEERENIDRSEEAESGDENEKGRDRESAILQGRGNPPPGLREPGFAR